jgi:hypothetical protein
MRDETFFVAMLAGMILLVMFLVAGGCKMKTNGDAGQAAQLGNSVVPGCRAVPSSVSQYDSDCGGTEVWTMRCRNHHVYACSRSKRHGVTCSVQSKPANSEQ